MPVYKLTTFGIQDLSSADVPQSFNYGCHLGSKRAIMRKGV